MKMVSADFVYDTLTTIVNMMIYSFVGAFLLFRPFNMYIRCDGTCRSYIIVCLSKCIIHIRTCTCVLQYNDP